MYCKILVNAYKVLFGERTSGKWQEKREGKGGKFYVEPLERNRDFPEVCAEFKAP
jgi:hypothetical protein